MKHPNPNAYKPMHFSSDDFTFTHADEPVYGIPDCDDIVFKIPTDHHFTNSLRQLAADATEYQHVQTILLAYLYKQYGIEWYQRDGKFWYLQSYGVGLGTFITFHEMLDWILKADWKTLHAYRSEGKQDE